VRKTLHFAAKTLIYCRLFQTLSGAVAFPHGPNFQHLWVCLMVDREAIESILRVYGPPATEIFTLGGSVTRKDIPFLPYVTAVDTNWTEGNNNEESNSEDTISEASDNEKIDDEVQEEPRIDDGEYHGHLKCALRSILQLWQNEQSISPEEYYPRDRLIWGDIGFVYEAPGSLH
jgi:hypothetical protein